MIVECFEQIQAPAQLVFEVVHDYEKRLLWDPFLRRAEVLGEREPGEGVKTFCAVKYRLLAWGMTTQYVSFRSPRVAAVTMIDGPFFFQRFTASIRHRDLENGFLDVFYKLNFNLKGFLGRRPLEKMIAWLLLWEAKKRLCFLKKYIEGS